MTLEEAKKVAGICENADGGCSHCVQELREMLQEIFPQFFWVKGSGYASIEVAENPNG